MNKKNKTNKKIPRIFQIGFSNSGSIGLANAFFADNSYKVIYNNFKESEFCYRQYLAILLYQNMMNKRHIIYKELENYDVFMNMECILAGNILNFNKYFKQIEEDNIGSIFILTIRPVNDWILSVMKSDKIDFNNENDIKSFIDYYFDHCVKLRDYFIRDTYIKNRSKFYVYYLFKTDIQDFFKEMGLAIYPDVTLDQSLYKNHEYNHHSKINTKLEKYINDKLKIHGDPFQETWWK